MLSVCNLLTVSVSRVPSVAPHALLLLLQLLSSVLLIWPHKICTFFYCEFAHFFPSWFPPLPSTMTGFPHCMSRPSTSCFEQSSWGGATQGHLDCLHAPILMLLLRPDPQHADRYDLTWHDLPQHHYCFNFQTDDMTTTLWSIVTQAGPRITPLPRDLLSSSSPLTWTGNDHPGRPSLPRLPGHCLSKLSIWVHKLFVLWDEKTLYISLP